MSINRVHFCTALALIGQLAVTSAAFPSADPAVTPAVAVVVTVRDAVIVAVRQRFGRQAAAEVVVSELRTDVGDAAGLVAVPDPGARTGRPAQFTLRVGSRRVGTAVARVDVTARHMRATAALPRDTAIDAANVSEAQGEVVGVRFEPLPLLDDVVGAQTRRDVAPGEVLSHAIVVVPPTVRAGDELKVLARVGALEAWGVGRASGSGRVGDIVRITRGGAPGLQRARVLSPGVVQVLLEQSQEIR
jgi:flagella basal body P-ring formation protein FlgA